MMTITHNPTGGGTLLSLTQIELLAKGDAALKMLYVAGYATPQSMKLNASERAAFEAAKRDGYYFFDPPKVRVLAHAWLETSGRPSIQITTRARTATIEMDLISAPRKEADRWRDSVDLDAKVTALAKSFGGRAKQAGLYNLLSVPSTKADGCALALRALYDQLTAAP